MEGLILLWNRKENKAFEARLSSFLIEEKIAKNDQPVCIAGLPKSLKPSMIFLQIVARLSLSSPSACSHDLT